MTERICTRRLESKHVTGNIAAIVKALVDAKATVHEHPRYGGKVARVVKVGDDSGYQAALAKVRNGDEGLCDMQLRQHGSGYRHYELGTNIYGWACGSMMASNIGGGKFAMTVRGATLEDCITFGCQAAMERPNRAFEFDLTDLPVDVQDALAAVGIE